MNKPASILISLPVSDLARSIDFYKSIGFSYNDKFPGDQAAHMILSEAISIMLITHSMWQGFTTREIPDMKKSAQAAFILSCDSKQSVNELIENGAKSGGVADVNPVEDFDGMYGRSVEDPDGHIWEAKWMDDCLKS